jgi:hypothetical protein
MRKKSLQVVVCSLVLLLCATCTSCSSSKASGPPTITSAVLGAGATESDASANPTSQFTTDTAKIYCLWKADGIQSATAVRGAWIAEEVAGGTPPNYKIDDATITLPLSGSGNFSLTKPNSGFPPGKYRLEIYLGTNLAKTVPFTVKAAS